MSSECGGGVKTAQRSHSDPSSNSKASHPLLLSAASLKDTNDLTLYGSAAPLRAAGRGGGGGGGGGGSGVSGSSSSGTVRRVSCCVPPAKDDTPSDTSQRSSSLKSTSTTSGSAPEPLSRSDKIRKSLDNSYRLSLESISEDKTYASTSLYPSIDCSPTESSSECMSDYACRSGGNVESTKDSNRTIKTSSSSYMSWIESVNSEYFDNAPGNSERTGEWNNFWKTYNAPRSPYFVTPYLCSGLDDNSAEEFSSRSMCESSGSTQKDLAYRYGDKIILSVEELTEAARCAQRIADILQNALKRAEIDMDESKHEKDKKYSADDGRKNSASFLKVPTTGSSYIDAILTHTGGVAEILKKVINKRRESIMPDPEEPDSRRSSASGWSEVEIVHKK